MAQTVLEQWIAFAQQIGVFRYLLPFLLTFAIIYTLLDNAGPFAGKSRNNALIAAIIGLFTTAFTPKGVALGVFFSQFFGAIAVGMVVLLVMMMGLGLLFGEETRERASGWLQVVAGIGILGVIVIFLSMGGLSVLFPDSALQGWDVMQQLQGVFVPLIIIGVVAFLYWSLGAEDGGE